MILHGPENIAGAARLLAEAQRAQGRDARAICHPREADAPGADRFGAPGLGLAAVLKLIATEVEVLHLYFGRSFTGDDLADAWLARALGKPVFMMLLGCDVRDSKWRSAPGETSMCTECWPQGCSLNRDRTLALIEALKTPPLVTTPDLLPGDPRAVWIPLPVDVAAWSSVSAPRQPDGPLRVLHAPTDRLKKGTRHVLAAIDLLQARGVPVELVLAEGIDRTQLQQLAASCHLAVDQVMAGVYGTFAAEMMAAGLPVVARIAPALRSAYPEDLPVIDATPDTLASLLEAAASGAFDLAAAGASSRAYAHRLHDHHRVAAQISALY